MNKLAGISTDGKYIILTMGDYGDSQTFDIYWVDAKILDQFRPEGF